MARIALPLFALGVALAACTSTSGDDASLTVGVQTQDFGTLVSRVHIVAKVDDQTRFDDFVPMGQGTTVSGLPKEIPLHGAAGAKVEVVADGLGPTASPTAPPIVSRRAITRLPADANKLLRVQLEARCVTLPLRDAPGLSCAAPTTCIAGQCASSDVPLDALEDYAPNWASAPPDVCRPASHGPPEVILGTGQTDYAPLADGQTLSMELGPQGGHHVWVAVRMRNLRQSGSTTTVTGKLVDDPSSPIFPSAVVFTFDRDEGPYCKLWGLRYQLDAGAVDLGNEYKRFLGKRLALTVEVADSTGARASSTKTIQLASTLICPDGTQSCNTP